MTSICPSTLYKKLIYQILFSSGIEPRLKNFLEARKTATARKLTRQQQKQVFYVEMAIFVDFSLYIR